MTRREDTRRGQIAAAIGLGYLLLLIYAIVTGNPLANTLADVFFVVLIVGMGGFVIKKFGTEPLPLVGGVALAASGIAQAVQLTTGSPTAQAASTVLLLVGLGIYLYLSRQE